MPQGPRNKQTLGHGREPLMPRLLGGRLGLDFVNTRDAPLSPQPTEFLTDYAALARWGHHVGLYDEARRDALLALAARQPAEAQRAFERALTLRAASHGTFLALAHGRAPGAADLRVIQQLYADALTQAALTLGAAGVAWTWPDDDHLERVTWAVLRSTVELLTSPDVARVKECPGCGDCGWLFLDSSKNGTRQWCSMEGCGSRAKMRRHYRRSQGADA